MAAKVNIGDIVQKMALFGVGGWVAENALCEQDRYSSVFRGAKIPFMPVYAANGVALTAIAPFVDTMVEFAGCYIDRSVLGGKAGSFGSVDALTRLSDGCVNFTRSALWGGMGLIAEKM